MTILLIDSASLWYRAFYGMPDSLIATDGTLVNAIRGFLEMSARLISQYAPSRILFATEGDWRPTWRTELFPAYKAHRVNSEGSEEEPDTLTPQIPILLDLLDLFNLPIIGVDDYEADDVIATVSVQERGPTIIATGDRDLFALVDDKRRVKVAYLAKGISQHELVDSQWISEKYKIPGDRYALFALIRGDTSDGLPGVRGIGEKGAAVIANNFSSIEEALTAARNNDEKLTPNLRKKLIDGADYIKIAPKLVHCALDVPIPKISYQIPTSSSSLSEIYQYKERYSLGSSVDRLISALKW